MLNYYVHFTIRGAKLSLFFHLRKDYATFSSFLFFNSFIFSFFFIPLHPQNKKGTCIRMDGKLYFCIDFLHRKPGKGNTIMNVTLKDVVNGGVIEKRFNIGERLEDVRVERRPCQYLYKDGDDLVFMNNETYEQITIAPDQVNGVKFLKESENVEVVVDASTETVLYADVPVKVHLQVTWTEPGLKGDTATNTLKPARVETGAEIRVPLFIEEGEIVEVDSRDGSYLGRVK